MCAHSDHNSASKVAAGVGQGHFGGGSVHRAGKTVGSLGREGEDPLHCFQSLEWLWWREDQFCTCLPARLPQDASGCPYCKISIHFKETCAKLFLQVYFFSTLFSKDFSFLKTHSSSKETITRKFAIALSLERGLERNGRENGNPSEKEVHLSHKKNNQGPILH